MTTDLSIIPQETALEVFTAPGGLEPYLAQIRAELDTFKGDVTTRKGREAIASMAFKVAKSKSYLEGVGKTLADEQKEIPKKIDAARKKVRDTLDAWKDEVRKPLTEWEAAEEARIAGIKADIEAFNGLASDREQHPSAFIRERLEDVKIQPITEAIYGEYVAAAAQAKDAAIIALERALAEAEKREADDAELAKLRKEAAEREAKERDARIATEAAARAKADAEAKALALAQAAEKATQAAAEAAQRRELELKLQAEKAEREKVEAQQRAERAEREAKEKAEREHAAKLKAEQAEADARETNKRHRAKINNAAMAAFIAGGIPEEFARLAVELIAKKAVPGVTISY